MADIDKSLGESEQQTLWENNRPLSPFFRETSPASFGIAHLLGLTFEQTADGAGQVRIQVDQRLMHPQQIVHGGIIFTLADTAMSMALSTLIPPGTLFGTIEAKINYLLPVRAGELVARGKVVHQTRTTAVLEATVYNLERDAQTNEESERAVARAMGTFYIKRQQQEQKV